MKKASLKILVVLVLIVAASPQLKFYAVQEALTILLVIAAALIVMLLTAIALLLFWEGGRLAFSWLTATVHRTARADSSRLSHGQVMSSPLLRR